VIASGSKAVRGVRKGKRGVRRGSGVGTGTVTIQ
jgi:hypothetical protein